MARQNTNGTAKGEIQTGWHGEYNGMAHKNGTANINGTAKGTARRMVKARRIKIERQRRNINRMAKGKIQVGRMAR